MDWARMRLQPGNLLTACHFPELDRIVLSWFSALGDDIVTEPQKTLIR